jgi:hypothetical protein
MPVVVGLARRFPVLIIIGVVAVGGIIFREHLSGAAADLRVGDCIELPSGSGEVSDVQHRPCSEAHDAEVFHVFDIASIAAGGPRAYPSDDQFTDILNPECTPAFDSYTGLSFDTALDFDWGVFTPGVAGWNDGDREVTCYIVRVDGAKLSGSMRAAFAPARN